MVQDRLQLLLEFYAQDPADPFNLYALATEYLSRGDTAAALDAYQRLHTAKPAYVATYYHYGKLLRQLGQPDQARQIYTEGIAVATAAKDQHSARELRQALQQLDEGDEDEL